MTRRTRLFLVGSGGILVLGLGTGVVASYMGLQGVVIGGDGPSELAYVPPDARAVAFANVREVMDSELRTKLMGIRPDRSGGPTDSPDQDRDSDGGFFEATGLDLEQDVDSVVASLTGSGGENDHPLMLARGRFNTGLIEAAIVQHAEGRSRIDTYKGTRMVIMPGGPGDAANGSQTLAVAFAEPGLLVLGTEAGVRRGLDAKQSGDNVIDNVELMKLVRDSDDGNAWAVARFDALAGRAQLPAEIASRLPAISWVAATGHVNGGLRAVLRAETRDDAAAQNLREVIRGLLALAQLQAGQTDQFTELLNSLELGGTGKTVSLGFAVDPGVIDALGALAIPRGPRPPATTAPALPSEPPTL
jgi:hypothetical protein